LESIGLPPFDPRSGSSTAIEDCGIHANLILTRTPPRLVGDELVVDGALCGDCIWVDALPHWPSFGGVAELSFEAGETGTFEVQILIRELTVDEEHEIYKNTVEVEVDGAARDSLIPYIRALQFSTEFGIYDPAHLEICVAVNGARLARRGLAIALEV
jgi:hypothetical protein